MPDTLIALRKIYSFESNLSFERDGNLNTLNVDWQGGVVFFSNNYKLIEQKRFIFVIFLTIGPLLGHAKSEKNISVDVNARNICIDSINHSINQVKAC